MIGDFSVSTTMTALLRTWPFLVVNLVFYGAVALAYIFVIVAGAIAAGGVAAMAGGEFLTGITLVGEATGFALVSAFLHCARDWILCRIKAGHFAMLAAVLDGRDPPGGMAQIRAAKSEIEARFAGADRLLAVDYLAASVVRAIAGFVDAVAAILPVPVVGGLPRFARPIVRTTNGLVSGVILAQTIHAKSRNPYATAQETLVLYTQNAVWILSNAVRVGIISWGLTLVLFLVFLALFLMLLTPAATIASNHPGTTHGYALLFATAFALCVRAAVLEPFATACLMQAYSRATERQIPRPDWHAHLEEVSGQFRALGAKSHRLSGPPDADFDEDGSRVDAETGHPPDQPFV